MPKFQNLSGMKFNMLTVIKKEYRNKSKQSCWKCICDCGNYAVISGLNLKNGNTKSCGCLQEKHTKIMVENNVTHGLSYKGHHHRIYNIWTNMKQRCYNPNNPKYKEYGGRGITICGEWKIDAMSFYNWAIVNGYSKNLSIDRIDNDGIYEPSNCRWATAKEQNNNKRNNSQIKTLLSERLLAGRVG